VDDLLNTFLGVDGRFIRAKVKKHTEGMHMTYTLDCDMDPSIRDMARRMLPLRQAHISRMGGGGGVTDVSPMPLSVSFSPKAGVL